MKRKVKKRRRERKARSKRGRGHGLTMEGVELSRYRGTKKPSILGKKRILILNTKEKAGAKSLSVDVTPLESRGGTGWKRRRNGMGKGSAFTDPPARRHSKRKRLAQSQEKGKKEISPDSSNRRERKGETCSLNRSGKEYVLSGQETGDWNSGRGGKCRDTATRRSD